MSGVAVGDGMRALNNPFLFDFCSAYQTQGFSSCVLLAHPPTGLGVRAPGIWPGFDAVNKPIWAHLVFYFIFLRPYKN
jgi:hypothetical protein